MDKSYLGNIKKQESYIHHEVYRVFKNIIKKGIIYKKENSYGNWEESFTEVLPEVNINKKGRADLVIYSERQYSRMEPRLVIEIKKRVFTNPGMSFARIAKRTKKYSEKLGVYYYVVYDGYYWLFFSHTDPYLIKAMTIEKDKNLTEEFANDFLLAFAEISYTSERKYSNNLITKYPLQDIQFVRAKIFPALANFFDSSRAEELINKWN